MANSASGLGAFASGLAGGIESGQQMVARGYALKTARDERENYEAYKKSLQDVKRLDPEISTAMGQQGPDVTYTSEDGRATVDKTAIPVGTPVQVNTNFKIAAGQVHDAIRAIPDPKLAEAAAAAFMARVSNIAMPYIGEYRTALENQDAEAAARAANKLSTLSGGGENTFKVGEVDDPVTGKKRSAVVNEAGQEIKLGHIVVAMQELMKNPMGALQAMAAVDSAASEEERYGQELQLKRETQADLKKYHETMGNAYAQNAKSGSAENYANALRLLSGDSSAARGAGSLTDQQRLTLLDKARTTYQEEAVDQLANMIEDPEDVSAAVANDFADYAAGIYMANPDITHGQAGAAGAAVYALLNKGDKTKLPATEIAEAWIKAHGVAPLTDKSNPDNFGIRVDGQAFLLPPSIGRAIQFNERRRVVTEPPPENTPNVVLEEKKPAALPTYIAPSGGRVHNAPIGSNWLTDLFKPVPPEQRDQRYYKKQ